MTGTLWRATKAATAATIGLSLLALSPPADAGGDGPEISRSRGKKGGVVVLWPRVVPATEDAAVAALAGQVQQQLAELASDVVDPRRVDVRPAPERVCSQVGCKAASINVMIGQRNGGCALVGIVSGPETSPQQLLPLAGQLQLAGSSAPFRQPPEQFVTVTEFVPCSQVLQQADFSGMVSALQRMVPATL